MRRRKTCYIFYNQDVIIYCHNNNVISLWCKFINTFKSFKSEVNFQKQFPIFSILMMIKLSVYFSKTFLNSLCCKLPLIMPLIIWKFASIFLLFVFFFIFLVENWKRLEFACRIIGLWTRAYGLTQCITQPNLYIQRYTCVHIFLQSHSSVDWVLSSSFWIAWTTSRHDYWFLIDYIYLDAS